MNKGLKLINVRFDQFYTADEWMRDLMKKGLKLSEHLCSNRNGGSRMNERPDEEGATEQRLKEKGGGLRKGNPEGGVKASGVKSGRRYPAS